MSKFIEDALKRKHQKNPQMEYMWRVSLPDIRDIEEQPSVIDKLTINKVGSSILELLPPVAIYRAVTGTSNTTGIMSAFDDDVAPQSEIDHRVTSFDIPTPSINTRQVISVGAGWKAVGGKELAPITIKMMEYEDGATLKYITAWMKNLQNDDGTYNPPVSYKRKITLIRMSVSGIDLHTSECIGCFPIEVSTVNHSYDSSGIVQYSITFAVDKIVHDIIPYDTVLKMIENEQMDIYNSPTNPFSNAFDISRHVIQGIFGV